MKIYADEDFGAVEVVLVNEELWRSFHAVGTEMIITKTGRRMFPSLQLRISGLDPGAHYSLLVEFALSSPHKYKYKTAWEPVGDAERHLAAPEGRLYRHPQGRALGSLWVGQTLHLNKIKLANALVDGTILLNSMHKYVPRIHLIKQTHPASHWQAMPATTRAVFAFPHTEFIAVTAYANEKITQLKIANNPFAKGFRSEGNYGKRKLQAKPADESDSKKRRVSEEINVVDLDDEEANDTQDKQHNSPLRLEENGSPRTRTEDLNEPINERSDDDVFETKASKTLEDHTEEHNSAFPQVGTDKNGSPKENQQPASSNVIRRLEERVSTRNAKAKTNRDPLRLVNRTPNAAIKILNNITNQSPNIEMCNGCRRLRPQFYRPWENNFMCHCRRAESSSERTDNVLRDNVENRVNDELRVNAGENKCDNQVNERHETPRSRNAFNMSRILETVSTSQASPSHLESSVGYPQYYTTSVPTYSNLYHTIYSSNQRGLSYFGKIEQPRHFYRPSYLHEKILSHVELRGIQHPSDLTVSSSGEDNEDCLNVNHHDNMQIRMPYPLVSRYETIRNEASSSDCVKSEAINNEVNSADRPHHTLNERNDTLDVHNEQAINNPVEPDFRIHNEQAMRSPADFSDQEEEEQALDFSVRDGEAHRARSPSNYSTVSSSSGYESRNSSSSELQSPPPSPQLKYDRYYSLPNISIVSTLF